MPVWHFVNGTPRLNGSLFVSGSIGCATLTVDTIAAASGTASFGSILLTPTAFASLPSGAEGKVALVTDSNTATPGATVAGGGANNILAFHNGSNWICA